MVAKIVRDKLWNFTKNIYPLYDTLYQNYKAVLIMTKRKSKKECEAIFVDEILKEGFKWYAVTYERGHYYWCFQLSTCQRFWTNLSKASCHKLGIDDTDGIER